MESKTDSGVKEYITPPIVILILIQLLCFIVSWHQSMREWRQNVPSIEETPVCDHFMKA